MNYGTKKETKNFIKMATEDIIFIVQFVFIIYASIKTYLLLKYFHVFDEVKRYLLLPNVLFTVLLVVSLMLMLKDFENLHKLVVLAFTMLAGAMDILGRENKSKIMIVLSLLFYMYVVGICWTKSLIFIIPFGA